MRTTDDRAAVAFLVSSLRFGGAEKHVMQLFNGLDGGRFRKGLVYLKREEHLLDQVKRPEGEVWCADFGKGIDVAGLIRLKTWMSDFRPQVLLCVNSYPLLYAHLARATGTRCGAIAEIFHSTELPTRQSWYMRHVYLPFFNRSQRVVYVSSTQQSYWESRGIRSDTGVCVQNGISPEYFQDDFTPSEKLSLRQRYGFAEHDLVVGICAALRPEKQHVDLLRAIAWNKQQGIRARCMIIGDGPMRSVIERHIVELDLLDDVVITGFQSDVRAFVAACDCMAIVSHQVETFSLAALESMSLGKPMIMSDVGGAREQVAHGKEGLIFPRGDIKALAQAIATLGCVEQRNQMGQSARNKVVSQFAVDQMLQKYGAIINELAS